MPKIHYFSTNFWKSPSAGAWGTFYLPVPLNFFRDLKLRYLAKEFFLLKLRYFVFFSKWLWRNQNLTKQLRRHFSDVIVIASTINVTKLTSQDIFYFRLLPIKISGCARGDRKSSPIPVVKFEKRYANRTILVLCWLVDRHKSSLWAAAKPKIMTLMVIKK